MESCRIIKELKRKGGEKDRQRGRGREKKTLSKTSMINHKDVSFKDFGRIIKGSRYICLRTQLCIKSRV